MYAWVTLTNCRDFDRALRHSFENHINAWVAQLVEHFPEEEGVGGSSPPPSTKKAPAWGLSSAWGVTDLRQLRPGSKGAAMLLCNERAVVKNT